jgi:NAD/NADP transhydrogenase beta subunit
MQPAPVIAYVIAAIIFILILSFRLRRMRRTVPLRLKRLWIAPAIFGVMTVTVVGQFPLPVQDWAWLVLALLVGAMVGWQRGRLMHIAMDPATRGLTMQPTPMAIYFLLGLVAVRVALRTGLGMEARGWGLSEAFINDIFVLFALGLFVAQSVEMAIRARRLLARSPIAPAQSGAAGDVKDL